MGWYNAKEREMIQACLGTLRLRLNFEYHRVPFWGAIKRRLKTSSAPRVDFEVILRDGSPDYPKKMKYFLGAVFFLANM